MSRFFSPAENISGDRITISGKEAHHILRVMRLKLEDSVTIFDNQGNEYKGQIAERGKENVVVKLGKKGNL